MKKSLFDIFDCYEDENVNIKNVYTISPDDIIKLTKSKISDETFKPIKSTRRISILIVAVVAACLLSITACAAIYFLTPKDVAQALERYQLAELFTDEDTIYNIPPQQSGGYNIKLLGIASGTILSDYSNVDTEKTYFVIAISNSDGTPVLDYSDLMVSPFVKGYQPWLLNIFTIDGVKKRGFIYEGVEYNIFECSNIEIFADKTVYLAVYDGLAPSRSTFAMADDGTISFNEEYTGVQAMFEIPLDKSKADVEAANELLEKIGF